MRLMLNFFLPVLILRIIDASNREIVAQYKPAEFHPTGPAQLKISSVANTFSSKQFASSRGPHIPSLSACLNYVVAFGRVAA
jgi:hypothetical protein